MRLVLFLFGFVHFVYSSQHKCLVGREGGHMTTASINGTVCFMQINIKRNPASCLSESVQVTYGAMERTSSVNETLHKQMVHYTPQGVRIYCCNCDCTNRNYYMEALRKFAELEKMKRVASGYMHSFTSATCAYWILKSQAKYNNNKTMGYPTKRLRTDKDNGPAVIRFVMLILIAVVIFLSFEVAFSTYFNKKQSIVASKLVAAKA